MIVFVNVTEYVACFVLSLDYTIIFYGLDGSTFIGAPDGIVHKKV